MLIDIPVFLSFNADGVNTAYRCTGNQVFGCTITMRFDPADDTVRPQYALTYPPKPDTKFWPDDAGFLFDVMPRGATDKRFLELAAEDPESYLVNQDTST